VEWQDIRDFRNLLAHEYFGIDQEIVWKIIRDDLPMLISRVGEMMEETGGTSLSAVSNEQINGNDPQPADEDYP
jgi:hypothetical protein